MNVEQHAHLSRYHEYLANQAATDSPSHDGAMLSWINNESTTLSIHSPLFQAYGYTSAQNVSHWAPVRTISFLFECPAQVIILLVDLSLSLGLLLLHASADSEARYPSLRSPGCRHDVRKRGEFVTNRFRLGIWVSKQRRTLKKKKRGQRNTLPFKSDHKWTIHRR